MAKISFAQRMRDLFGGRDKDDAALFDDLTDALIEGDVGAKAAVEIADELKLACQKNHAHGKDGVMRELEAILLRCVKETSLAPVPGKTNVWMLLGVNGVGKTTLFKTVVGLEPLDAGDLKIGETVQISYVDQTRGGIDPEKTVWQVVSDGLDYIQVGNVEMPSRAYVSAFGFKGPDQQKKAGVLSGGERNRLNLALTLKQGGNLLLLDEPTNDLDVETLSSLENALLQFPGCAVVITHDRWFLDRVATHILAYEGTDEDPAAWYWFEGNFESYEKNKIERLGPEAARPHAVTYRKLTRD